MRKKSGILYGEMFVRRRSTGVRGGLDVDKPRDGSVAIAWYEELFVGVEKAQKDSLYV